MNPSRPQGSPPWLTTDHAPAACTGPRAYGSSDRAAASPMPATAATERHRPARAATAIPATPMANNRNAFW